MYSFVAYGSRVTMDDILKFRLNHLTEKVLKLLKEMENLGKVALGYTIYLGGGTPPVIRTFFEN